jgi:membrane protease YdiL (CAAX protease family)
VTTVPVEPTALPAPPRLGGAAVVALGSAALLARPLLFRAVANPVAPLVVLFVALGAAGLLWPLPAAAPAAGRLSPATALALGVGAFAVGRLLGPAASALALPGPLAPVLLNSLAAVAEEALFRRLLYGLVEPRGTGVAIVVTAVCFAAVHVTVWGAGVLPLDLAAGLLLGWQRAATGDWSVPAVTHVAANLLAVL